MEETGIRHARLFASLAHHTGEAKFEDTLAGIQYRILNMLGQAQAELDSLAELLDWSIALLSRQSSSATTNGAQAVPSIELEQVPNTNYTNNDTKNGDDTAVFGEVLKKAAERRAAQVQANLAHSQSQTLKTQQLITACSPFPVANVTNGCVSVDLLSQMTEGKSSFRVQVGLSQSHADESIQLDIFPRIKNLKLVICQGELGTSDEELLALQSQAQVCTDLQSAQQSIIWQQILALLAAESQSSDMPLWTPNVSLRMKIEDSIFTFALSPSSAISDDGFLERFELTPSNAMSDDGFLERSLQDAYKSSNGTSVSWLLIRDTLKSK